MEYWIVQIRQNGNFDDKINSTVEEFLGGKKSMFASQLSIYLT